MSAETITLHDVLITDEFLRRAARAPDYIAENRALSQLAQELFNSPLRLLQRLVELTLELCKAHSSGVSVLAEKQGERIFQWPAIAGEWAGHVGGTTPREFSPCGVVLDRDSVQMFSRFDRFYPYFSGVSPPTYEGLLIPFYCDGQAVGTVWVVSHDESRHFDPEDYRLLSSIANFASLAYRSLQMLENQALSREALRQSETQTRLALDVAGLGTWTWHMADAVVRADTRCREICGLTDQTLMSVSSLLTRVHHDDRPRITAALQAAQSLESDGCYSQEMRVVLEDGAIRWISVRGQALSQARTEGQLMLGTVLDITQSKAIEEELRNANRRKDQFLAMLGHELRGPLGSIRNGLQVAKLDGNNLRVERIIERQVDLMVRLVDDLSDVSRIVSGKVELRFHRVDLGRVVRQAMETCRPVIETAGHAVAIDLPEEPTFLNADPQRLQQIIVNLITNAAKYTPPNGCIKLSAQRIQSHVLLSVKDNGIGIPAHRLQHLFAPFSQIDEAVTMSQGGLGMGLFIVRRLVELHGGFIEVKSDGSGLGSEFIVTLPIAMLSAAESFSEAGIS